MAESTPGRFTFQLSEPAPEDGLTIYFRAGDDDIDPNTRDLNLDLEASTNIDDINLNDLPDRTSSITIPPGVTEASFVVVPFEDDRLEMDETIFAELIPQDDYTVDVENSFADFIVTEGLTQLVGTEQADNLEGANEAEILFGLAGDDILAGKEGGDRLAGGIGNDLLSGGEGNDRLTGVDYLNPQPGLDEVDELTGGLGEDLFILGQKFPTDTNSVFYNDGDAATVGTNDYALITDFDSSEGDKIQLVGEAGNYSLGISPEGLRSGTGIYLNDGDSPELIAIIADVSPEVLSLDSSEQFIFA